MKNIWTKDTIHKEALKYFYKIDFLKSNESAYKIAVKNGWLNDVCSHMKTKGSKFNRCIYSYEFSDNFVYIGLTYNIEKRHKERLNDKNDSVYKHINKTGLSPKLLILTKYIDVERAVYYESFYLNEYKENGWFILNKKKTGSIGGVEQKWNKTICYELALKCKTKNEFIKKYIGAYYFASKNGWLDDIYNEIGIKTYNDYTYNECKIEALKYRIRNDFRLGSNKYYKKALKSLWLEDICKHMIICSKPKNYWTFERGFEYCKSCKNKFDLKKKNISLYTISVKKKWLNQFFND
jgi:hypothetical protein